MRSALHALSALIMAALCMASLAIPHAHAGTGPETVQAVALDTQMFVERVQTDLNGRTRRILSSPARLVRGDQLVFVINWRNQGAHPLRDLALSVPGTVRIDPDDASMEVSVDGGARWGRIGDLWLPTPFGGARRATAEDVTHVRWAMPSLVQPGTGGRISYRGTVR
jgi:hypothetical protein